MIDKMTPQGQVPDDHHDIVAQALALLTQQNRLMLAVDFWTRASSPR